MRYILTIALLLVAATLHASHQSGSAATKDSIASKEDSIKKILRDSARAKYNRHKAEIQKSEIDSLEKDLQALFDNTRHIQEVNADYYAFVHAQKKKIYAWQLVSAKIILVVVLIVVLTGLFLSYLQFKTYEKLTDREADRLSEARLKAIAIQSTGTPAPDAETTPATQTGDGQKFTATTFEIDKSGLKINSAVIGLIILAISVAFFFMYLTFVFGIKSDDLPEDPALPSVVQHP